jgi:hypothetical protein
VILMLLFASFNYEEPSLGIVLAGCLVGLVVLALFGLSRSILVGCFGGALAGASIAWVVAGMGSGDLTGLTQIAGAVVFGFLGLIGGAIAALIGKRRRKDTLQREAGGKGENGHAESAHPPSPS